MTGFSRVLDVFSCVYRQSVVSDPFTAAQWSIVFVVISYWLASIYCTCFFSDSVSVRKEKKNICIFVVVVAVLCFVFCCFFFSTYHVGRSASV